MNIVHKHLPCGIELGVAELPGRHVVSFQIRVLAGCAEDPGDRLGLGRLVCETIDKGTSDMTGPELSDAFDAIGAGRDCGTGRETTTFTCTILPEHFERALELHASILRTPTFPEEAVSVALQLALQELTAMEDDAQAIVDKLISRKAFGPVLGRHSLGEREALESMSRGDIETFWRTYFHPGRMVVSVAGPLDPVRVADQMQRKFDGFGSDQSVGRDPYVSEFDPGVLHQHKDLEQQHIGICWPGVDAAHDDFPVQQVMIGVLSGGMSGRLFTEVREKQGLVYWVSAWQDMPRGMGMIFLGASTTPERCDRTLRTLLHEVDRLASDLEPEELSRAITGIVAKQETRGDGTRARCAELANDLFFFSKPIPVEEKIAKVQAVTVDDVRRYLRTYPRDPRCVVTLGPRPLDVGVGTLGAHASGD